MQSGKIVIITAPSGSGKTSIAHHLLQAFPQIEFSISATTRQPRGQEQHGRAYYFITTEAFKQHIANDAFLEWEMVYEGKYYGTLKSEINRMWAAGKVPLLDIDVKGAMRVQQLYPGSCLSIFIEAPSLDVLRQRLVARGTETEESLNARLSKAAYEQSYKAQFDAVVVNDDLQVAQQQTAGLIEAFLKR
ncbi:MAG: guanylate kinase [Chitinophagaceae bacterium]|jgi:guanylate kinase|nr:guanylate kinase [Chitinophagaceae bacterium]